MLLKNPNLIVTMATKAVNFSKEESQNKMLRQQVRLLRKFLADKSIVPSTVKKYYIGDRAPI